MEKEIMYLIVILYIFISYLYIQSYHLYLSIKFLHWKKEKMIPQIKMKRGIEKINKNRFLHKNKSLLNYIYAILPLVNVVMLALFIKKIYTTNFKYSSKYCAEDMCSWRIGIFYLIFKNFNITEKWKKRYPIE